MIWRTAPLLFLLACRGELLPTPPGTAPVDDVPPAAAADGGAPLQDAALGDSAPADAAWPSSPVPTVGADDTLDLASWNVRWFGAVDEGPRDKALQASRVRDVLAGVRADLWAFAEIVDGERLRRTVATLPGWQTLLPGDAVVTGGAQAYGPTEQKVALAYDGNVLRIASARVILADSSFDFAGRPPLEAAVEYRSPTGATRAFTVVAVHLKAGSDEESWGRRERSAIALKAYLDARAEKDPVFVIGDWNDELAQSKSGNRPSPFAGLVADEARYTFLSRGFEGAGETTMVSERVVNDHQMMTRAAAPWYQPGTAAILRLDRYFDRYGETTSDHFPVVSRFRP